MKNKIIIKNYLSKIKNKYKHKNIVLCHGVFDLLHFGHLKHFEKAKEYGEVLVVSITSSKYVNKGPGRPYFSDRERLKMLSSIDIVDYVYLNDHPLSVDVIKKLKPNFYIKGNDYKNNKQDITGGIKKEKDAVSSINGKIVYTNEQTYSSTSLINRYLTNFDKEQLSTISKLKKNYKLEDILKIINSFSSLKVLVVGEPIIDKYIYTNPLGMTNKDPIISSKILSEESLIGGSLAIANNLNSLGCNTSIIYPIGEKNIHEKLIKSSLDIKIRRMPYKVKDWEIPIKTRFINKSHMRKLFETNELYENIWEKNNESKFCQKFKLKLKNFDIIFLADFGHGFFKNKIIKLFESTNVFKALNVQTNSSNLGYNYFTKYKKYDYLSIDEREFNLGLGIKNIDTSKLIQYAIKEKKINTNLSITSGNKGSRYLDKKLNIHFSPIFFKDVVDTVGAGDAYFCITALLSKLQYPGILIPFLGNCFAGLKTRILANKKAVSKSSLIKTINAILG